MGHGKQRLNVGERVTIRRAEIRRRTEWLRSPLCPRQFVTALSSRGANALECVLVRFEDYPCCGWFGTILLPSRRFFDFEIHLDSETDEPIVESWQESSNSQDLAPRKPGIGVGEGCLALEVLAESTPAAESHVPPN